MEQGHDAKTRLNHTTKVLVGLGEEWKMADEKAYDALYELLKNKDYFIVTMVTDGAIYNTKLGSAEETVVCTDQEEPLYSCPATDEKTLELMDKLFPPLEPKTGKGDVRRDRIVAPCGNETWRQCSKGCTKDIWEAGEIPDDICPHCHAPLTGNTIEADPYIEEGYLPQWDKYIRWLAETLNQEMVILELGVGFGNPGVIRFPFEKTCFFSQKTYLYRVNRQFYQVAAELKGRAEGICQPSLEWIRELAETESL